MKKNMQLIAPVIDNGVKVGMFSFTKTRKIKKNVLKFNMSTFYSSEEHKDSIPAFFDILYIQNDIVKKRYKKCYLIDYEDVRIFKKTNLILFKCANIYFEEEIRFKSESKNDKR